MADINRVNDRLFRQLLKRLAEVYGQAAERIIRQCKAFLARMEALQTAEPPQQYTPQQKRAWLRNEIQRAAEEERVEARVGDVLAAAGITAAALISSCSVGLYRENRGFAQESIRRQMGRQSPAFRTLTARQIEIILQDSMPPGTQIAYRNLGSSPTFIRRFQREMIAVTMGGEGQPELVGRLMDAMRETSKSARKRAELIAQTERTRIQSQARSDMDGEAEQMGIRMAEIWLCQMIPPHKTSSGWSSGSRDSHIALHREARRHGQPWVTIHGHTLRYPGDPSAPPGEICRCHCVLEPRVLLKDEDVVDGLIVRRSVE